VTVEEFRQTLDVNVVGALNGIQTFLELHDAAGGGAGFDRQHRVRTRTRRRPRPWLVLGQQVRAARA
jgi:hypothetical protein